MRSLNRLPAETQQILRVATAGGSRIGHGLLVAVAGLDVQALNSALRPAVAANVLVSDGDGYVREHASCRGSRRLTRSAAPCPRARRWGMAWFTTGDLAEFLAAAGGFLKSRPAENTVILTVSELLRARGDAFGDVAPLFGWWRHDDGTVRGAFLQTPPYPAVLSLVPTEALAPLAEVFASVSRPLTGINAESATAKRLAEAWREHAGATAEISMRERLFRLGELVPLSPAPRGNPRAPRESDGDLLGGVVRGVQPGDTHPGQKPPRRRGRPPQLRRPDPVGVR